MNRLRRFLMRHAAAIASGLILAWLVVTAGGVMAGLRVRGWAVGSLAVLAALLAAQAVWVRWQREVAIREGALPAFLKRKLRETYPHLQGRDCDLVERGMRQFFMACLRSRRQFVAMPSKVVDAYWHEFILHTRAYEQWCELTLGRFLHHTPAEALGARARDNDGLRRAWFWSCREESILPRKPSRLPLLFALDAKLAIAGGFSYVPDCGDISKKSAAGAGDGGVYCGASFSDGSHAGDSAGLGGVDSSGGHGHGDGGHGGGDGSGCGGDGGGGGGCSSD